MDFGVSQRSFIADDILKVKGDEEIEVMLEDLITGLEEVFELCSMVQSITTFFVCDPKTIIFKLIRIEDGSRVENLVMATTVKVHQTIGWKTTHKL